MVESLDSIFEFVVVVLLREAGETRSLNAHVATFHKDHVIWKTYFRMHKETKYDGSNILWLSLHASSAY